MNTLGTVAGVLVGVLGLAIMDYGLDSQVEYASQAFSLGIVGVAAGGFIVWLSNSRQNKSILTKRYEVESQTLATKEDHIKYKNLYEGSPILQRTVNTDGIIIECNQAYAKTFGYSKGDMLGRSLFEHTAEKSLEDMHKTFETWKKSGRVENVEIWLKRKDSTTFPALLSANNIYDERGKMIGSNTVIRDVSEIYQAHQVLADNERQRIQLEELMKKDSTKEGFYMMVSKEFQLPLEPIKKCSTSLKDGSLGKITKKQKEAIDEIYNNAERLEQLINDIIDVQKLNSNKMEFKKETFVPSELIKSVNEKCSPMMEEKKINFLTAEDSKLPIKSDKGRLEQVFYNLVQNAVDFVPSERGRIEIGAKEEQDSLLFYVKDNGIGIPEKRKDSVFKQFYQVDLTFKRKYGGSGFGLVICKGIIENLGGKIWFESKEGEGTSFYFSIPK